MERQKSFPFKVICALEPQQGLEHGASSQNSQTFTPVPIAPRGPELVSQLSMVPTHLRRALGSAAHGDIVGELVSCMYCTMTSHRCGSLLENVLESNLPNFPPLGATKL